MRRLLRFLGICLLLSVPFFACMDFGSDDEEETGGCGPYQFDLGGGGDPCQGVVCPDDGNPCTVEYCSSGVCRRRDANDGTPCTYDGGTGVCVERVCGENLCEGVTCNDEPCRQGICDFIDGLCDYIGQSPDGTPCVYGGGLDGVCVNGVCDENLCEGVACDDEPCREGFCDFVDGLCDYTGEELPDGTACVYAGGLAGVCVSGACGENLCEGVTCNDGDPCTEDTCEFTDGSCAYMAQNEGALCELDGSLGRCIAGVCRTDFRLWLPQESGTTEHLLGVSCPAADTCTAVGRQGLILRTSDGGVTWLRQNAGEVTHTLFGISFTDATTGTAVGYAGRILRTTDGGETWATQHSATIELLSGVSFIDTSTGTIVGHSATILWTMDGGETWLAQTSGAEPSNNLRDVCLVDRHTATAVGDGEFDYKFVLRTEDDGETWVAQGVDPSTLGLSGIACLDANTAIAVGSHGTILRTMNRGDTWVRQNSGTDNALYDVSFTDAETGTVVGDTGTILRTEDGGATWVKEHSDTTRTLRSVTFSDASHGTIVGDYGVILRMSD